MSFNPYAHVEELVSAIEERSIQLYKERENSFILGYLISYIQADLDELELTEKQVQKLEHSLNKMKRYIQEKAAI